MDLIKLINLLLTYAIDYFLDMGKNKLKIKKKIEQNKLKKQYSPFFSVYISPIHSTFFQYFLIYSKHLYINSDKY